MIPMTIIASLVTTLIFSSVALKIMGDADKVLAATKQATTASAVSNLKK
jgi:hypothetical protein